MAWVEVWTSSYLDKAKFTDGEPIICVESSYEGCVRAMSGHLHWSTGLPMVSSWDELKVQVAGISTGHIRVTEPFSTVFDPGDVTHVGG